MQGVGVLGTIQTMQLDQSYPLEGISIIIQGTIGATGLTFPTTPGSVNAVDNIYSILQNATLSVTEPGGQRTVLNASGAAIIELNQNMGGCVDPATLNFVGATAMAANLNFRLMFYVPLVPSCLGEDLRTRHLLPIHLHGQPPVLSLQYGTFANISSTGSFSALSTTIILHRRQFPTTIMVNGSPQVGQTVIENQIAASGGYIKFDLIEQFNTVPVGASAPTVIPISIPGQYGCLVARHYLGGATMSRAFIDGSSSSGFGTEPIWTLDTAGNVIRSFTWTGERLINDLQKFRNGNSQANSPELGAGAVAANTAFTAGASACLDFFGDIVGAGDVTELGSLLDTNSVSSNNQKIQFTGIPANVATNPSVLSLTGYRYLGNVSYYQTFK